MNTRGLTIPTRREPALTTEHPARLTTGQRIARWWLGWLGIALIGYMTMGKGFAYIGAPPLFISEVTLLAGLAMLLFFHRLRVALTQLGNLLILMMVGWCVARTWPYLSTYGFDAPRDAMICGYALIAVCISAAVIEYPELFAKALHAARRALPWLVIAIPLAVAADIGLGSRLPRWPWADVGIITTKMGDPMVHLGAITAFLILGLGRLPSSLWLAPLIGTAGVLSVVTRGGMLAFLSAAGLAALLYPRSQWLWRGVIIGFAMLALIVFIDPQFKVRGRERKYSVQQAIHNVTSVIGSNSAGDLEDTKSWRLDWWTKIVNYTIHGPHFWAGKGFGINLANSDGFQVHKDDSLRSPHNGHMTILARAGVIGLALWSAVHLYWLWLMRSLYARSRQRGDETWNKLAVLLLAYWLALNIHASFDVYFENPMGGIWLWSVIGVGIGADWVYRHHPEVLPKRISDTPGIGEKA